MYFTFASLYMYNFCRVPALYAKTPNFYAGVPDLYTKIPAFYADLSLFGFHCAGNTHRVSSYAVSGP